MVAIPFFVGEDFNGVLKEYEQLKAEGKLRKIFPRIPMDKFIEVLYPSVRMDDLLSFSSFSRSVEVETNIQSRVDHQCTYDAIGVVSKLGLEGLAYIGVT